MGDLSNEYSYEIQREELELKNEKDNLQILQFQLRLTEIQYGVHDLELNIKKAQTKIDSREEQIKWLTSKIDG